MLVVEEIAHHGVVVGPVDGRAVRRSRMAFSASAPSWRAACTESVTSSIRTMNMAVSPGFVNSSSSDMAQNPSFRMSRSRLLWLWIWPYLQWWFVSRSP